MFTRPKHIIYSSDSKAEQKLFICVTVAAEATGAPCAVFGEISPERSGLMRKPRHGASQRFGCTCVQNHSHSWKLTMALWFLPEPGASELLRMCEAVDTDCSWSREVHNTSVRVLGDEGAKIMKGLSEMS